jgi:hypothetical protein
MVPINYLAVLVAAIVAIVLGFLWYGPFFGKPWMKLMGITPEKMEEGKKKGMGGTYAMMTVTTLLMSFVLSHALVFAATYLDESGWYAGVMTGFWNWLGFVVPVSMGSVLWERKPWKLWCINAGYYLVSMMLMGIVLALWV